MADSKNYIGAVLVRGMVGAKQEVKDTLQMLNLTTKNSFVALEDNLQNRKMLHKAKDRVTFGELNEDSLKLLKPGQVHKLNPPRGGFERKGIKKPFKIGGAIGYRGNDINDLIKKMVEQK